MTTTTTESNKKSMPLSTPNRGIDQVLNETDLGSWIARNKSAVVSLLLIVVASLVAFGIKYKMDKTKHIEKSALIFQFENKFFKIDQPKENQPMPTEAPELKEGFVQELMALVPQLDGYEGGNVLVVKSVDRLIEEDRFDEARKVIQLSLENDLGQNDYMKFFLTTRMAVLQEDTGDLEGAVKSLESLMQSPVKVMQGKIYLDLGRLYKELGNLEKARTNFEYVVANSKQQDFLKMAKLYLSELK